MRKIKFDARCQNINKRKIYTNLKPFFEFENHFLRRFCIFDVYAHTCMYVLYICSLVNGLSSFPSHSDHWLHILIMGLFLRNFLRRDVVCKRSFDPILCAECYSSVALVVSQFSQFLHNILNFIEENNLSFEFLISFLHILNSPVYIFVIFKIILAYQ